LQEDDSFPQIEILSIETIEQLFESIRPRNDLFTLLLAWDAPVVDHAQLEDWMRPVVEHGLAYFCAWGAQCEAVHDAVDRCDIAMLNGDIREDNIIMTTWHHDESLEEALQFFANCADLTGIRGTSIFDRFAVSVGNPKWAEEMRGLLSNPDF
jgi:hypothetical protein